MIKIENKLLNGMKFIDLFAGLGAFRIALESLGAKCVYSNEWNKNVKQVYKSNFGDEPEGDITKVAASSIPDHDILCAGFPCQAFSISGNQMGFNDSRGTLFFDIARIVKEKKPKIVFMENVKNFASHNNGKTIEVVHNTMNELGYSFHQKILNSANYGIPQKRERIYMICFRNDLNVKSFKYPKAFPLKYYLDDLIMKNKFYNLNISRSDIQMKQIVNDTHKNKAIRLGKVNKGRQGERIYSTKGIAISLSSYGGGVFSKTGGYLINNKIRKLAPRECARIMGFPDSYKLSSSDAQAYKQLGNSAVIDVLQYIGIQIGESIHQLNR